MSQVDTEDRLQEVIISPQISIWEAIPLLDCAGMGILLLCEEDRKLVGVLTDGDIRRAILRGVSFEEPCITIASRNPVIALPQISPAKALHLMDHSRDFVVNHLPVVDEEGRVVNLLLRRDLITQDQLALSAVIMAGGFGARLRPLTEELPKPMLPVGSRPLMELIIEQLRQAGIRRINVTTHYRSEEIIEYFGDGRVFGVELNYVTEDRPLGTAGGLGLIEASNEPLLVINGDILTRVDFRAMLDYHREQQADMTVAVRPYEFRVPYGVIETNGVTITGISEKPVIRHFINAGIYLLNADICRYIPNNQTYDMPDLIARLIAEGRQVVGFPIREYWLDIGHIADLERAKSDVTDGNF